MKYLKPDMLSLTFKEAKVLAVRNDPENRFGPSVVLKLALAGETIFWNINLKRNPNYQLLEKQFGLDENDWVGQKILLGLEQDGFSENYFIRVDFPEAQMKEVKSDTIRASSRSRS
jgi:hypothetical protein